MYYKVNKYNVIHFISSTHVQLDDAHETAGHSRAPDNAVVAATKVAVNMRSAIQSAPGVRPSSVMSAELLRASTPARAAIGKKKTIQRRLRRQKRGVQPAEPSSLDQIDLPSDFKETGDATPERFLIHDSGPTAHRRMLVFASKEQLKHLATSDRYAFIKCCLCYACYDKQHVCTNVFTLFEPITAK